MVINLFIKVNFILYKVYMYLGGMKYLCVCVWINNILPVLIETVTVLYLNCVRNIRTAPTRLS